MARLNIEEEFWVDILSAAVKMGNMDEAIGNAIRFIRVSQENYKNQRIMTEEEFKEQGFSEALFPRFAKKTEAGIVVKGAEKHFGWYSDGIQEIEKQRTERSLRGGRARMANAPRDKKGHFINIKNSETENDSSLRPSISPPASSPIQPNPARLDEVVHRSPPIQPSSSSSSSSLNTYSVRGETEVANAPPTKLKIQKFIGAFVTAHEKKFGVRPDLTDPKLRGQLSNYAKNHSDIDRACVLIQVFFQIKNKWFDEKGYDFSTYLANVQKVALALDTGKDPAKTSDVDWDYVFRGVPA